MFVDAEDYQAFVDLLRQLAQTHLVAVHGFVLMPNHFHLLVTPQTEQGVPQLMQALGRSYVRYFNARHGRTGTLWEGRYRSTVVEPTARPRPTLVLANRPIDDVATMFTEPPLEITIRLSSSVVAKVMSSPIEL